jgi:hypothetical protein
MQKRSSQNKYHFGVGGKLLRHLQAWRDIGGDYLIRRGMYADWVGALPPHQNRTAFRKEYRGVMHTRYLAQLQEELQQGIIQEVHIDQCLWLSPTFLVPKPGGEWRKVMDCRQLNLYLRKRKFKMEDQRTVV